MSTTADWVKGYARQADADFKTFQDLQGNKAVPQCHKLLFLQMACEKLCKAHLILAGSNRELLQTSHGYVAGPLPTTKRRADSGVRQSLSDARVDRAQEQSRCLHAEIIPWTFKRSQPAGG